MAITTELRQGKLNPSKEKGLSLSVFSTGADLLIDTANIDFSVVTAGNGLKKKFIMTCNTVSDGKVTENLVYDSGLSEILNTQWKYEKFRDGWYSLFLFAMDTRVTNLFAVPLVKGDIVYYENAINNSSYAGTGFYVYKGSPVTYTGVIQKSNADFKTPEYSDWVNYAAVIGDGSSTGEYGAQQSLVIYSTGICKDNILLKTLNGQKDGCSTGHLNGYNNMDMILEGAALNFRRQSFLDAQDLVQSAIAICEDFDCTKC